MRVTTAADLGTLVREKRTAAGMTQRELASLAGVSRLWLVHVESGHPGAEFGRVLQLLASLDLALELVERGAAATWRDLTGTTWGDLVRTSNDVAGHETKDRAELPERDV